MRRVGLFLAVLVATSLTAVAAAGASTPAANSGAADSACVPTEFDGPYTAPPTGVVTTGLGADAPAYYEVGRPAGGYYGQPAKGVMLLIHGGAWYAVGKTVVAAMRNQADRWRNAGWLTVSVDYRGCAQSFDDVLWFMKRIRQNKPNAVVCADGFSAGAHLALLLAAVRPDLACVIANAGPSDFVGLRTQMTPEKGTGVNSTAGPQKLANFAAAAFGGSVATVARISPSTHIATVKARVLMASGQNDVLVPVAQNRNYALAFRASHPLGYVDVAVLAPGPLLYVHAGVSQSALDDLHARENALVAPLVG
ncbi:MAG: hypothetical protein QOK28_1817 [Actinomycetota bacterium]|jgi:acetyl esterase/lipase